MDPPTPEPGVEGARPRLRFYPFRDVFVDRVPVRLGHDVFTKGRPRDERHRRGLRRALALSGVDGRREGRSLPRRRDERRAYEAQNGDVFVERAEREAGIHVDVIEGVEEARLVQLAVGENASRSTIAPPCSSTSAAARPSSR